MPYLAKTIRNHEPGLCYICARLDFTKIFATRSNKQYGVNVCKLGKLSKLSACPCCRFFAETHGSQEPGECQLRVLSTRPYFGFRGRTKDIKHSPLLAVVTSD